MKFYQEKVDRGKLYMQGLCQGGVGPGQYEPYHGSLGQFSKIEKKPPNHIFLKEAKTTNVFSLSKFQVSVPGPGAYSKENAQQGLVLKESAPRHSFCQSKTKRPNFQKQVKTIGAKQ